MFLRVSRFGVVSITNMGSVDSAFLVATPSVITGMGSCLNLAGGYFLYNQHLDGIEADASAIRRDWLKTAEDLRAAIAQSTREAARESR